MMRDDAVALKIVNKAMLNVKSQLEPLTYAVNILEPKAISEDYQGLMTDGRNLYFNSRYIIGLYERGDVKYLEYQVIHILLHGILGHFSDNNYSAKKLAWRVMDLEVEQIMEEIGLTRNGLSDRPKNYKTIGMGLYYQSLRNEKLRKYVLNVGIKRQIDDHELWWTRKKDNSLSGNGCSSNSLGDAEGENGPSGEDMVADKWKKAREYLTGSDAEITSETVSSIAKNLKSQSRGCGSESGSASKNVNATENRYSFRTVFREFMQNKTISKDQPDYLDQMLYQYGIDMYENIPLIEPMEETEEVRLSNLVIAIDTSGSCEDYVCLFLSQIMSIFREISAHFTFEKIFLIQCDYNIKNVCEFSEIEELAEVNGSMRMYGFGGTSFTPVFRWTEKNLIEQGEQVDCLLYLSDGEATFSVSKPEYPVFFILPEEKMGNTNFIPNWVRKVSIKSE